MKKELDFEQAMKELEVLVDLVEKMEGGEINLEQSLDSFERGIELTRICQQTLQSAEQKVEILLEKNGQQRAEAFNPENI
ncbi:MAG: exodeoxyribonuclease VII small subunit [Gammaproteobacteria bacterium]|nr:exodeoxyribonuclease VII small subunit [Gammaproteobacteria bacterium]